MRTKSNAIRVHAVKLDRSGWVGVGPTADRCEDHRHQTPELAKLCALHREGERALAAPNVVLLPVAPPASERASRQRRRLG